MFDNVIHELDPWGDDSMRKGPQQRPFGDYRFRLSRIWRSFRFESLEMRLPLTGGGVDLQSLQLDTSVFDSSSILVRLSDEGVTSGSAGQILAGSSFGKLLGGNPRLRKVTLPPSVDVASAIAAYSASPFVEYAQPDYQVSIAAIPNDPMFDSMWPLVNTGQTGGKNDADIDAAFAWDINTGSGDVVVAVIDTGVDHTHPDLSQNVWLNEDEIPASIRQQLVDVDANGRITFEDLSDPINQGPGTIQDQNGNGLIDGGDIYATASWMDGVDTDGNGYLDDFVGFDFANDDFNPMDDHSHGTHVAGTIGATANNGMGVSGINWEVQVMALKFLDSSGVGQESDAIEALSYAVSNGAIISNNSWGGDPFSQLMLDAITDARDAGHLFVAASGNGNSFGVGQNNDANLFYPASYNVDNIIAVAATDHNDTLANFSNYGQTTVDLAAPGVSILSTGLNGSYFHNTGTSMAAPHVAGAAALLWDENPGWSYDQVISQILGTVDSLPSLQGVTVTGGRLNLASAMGNPEPPPPPPPPVALPAFDDFEDGVADFIDPQSGNWSVNGGRFDVTPSVDDSSMSSVSTLRIVTPLPSDVDMHATVNANPEPTGILKLFFNHSSNAYIVFDYVDSTTFKFAGLDVSGSRWLIGERTAGGWQVTAALPDATIGPSNSYLLTLVIQNDTDVTLFANGVAALSHTYAQSVTDGDLGLGVRNSISHFDNVSVRAYTPPQPPGTLPINEDFSDGVADHFVPRTLGLDVNNGLYHATPPPNANAISTIGISNALPPDLDLQATMNADLESGSYFSDAFIIFDYHSNVDFKFAGAYVRADDWVIGHRTHSTWVADASLPEIIDASRDYDLRVIIENDSQVTLMVDGVTKLTHDFGGSLTDGEVGVATWNAVSRFDDVVVQQYVPPPPPPLATLPYQEDFADGVADSFVPQVGSWDVSGGRYHATPNGDAITTLAVAGALPTDVELQATMNADLHSGSFFSDALLIFDYQSPTDFKFAGAYVKANKWVIGHRTASTWVTDVELSQTINAGTDYQLQLIIENDNSVRLLADGVEKVAHVFAGSLTDGELGLGTWNAFAHFDDVVVQQYVPLPPPPLATLPYQEDFADGVADSFVPQVGSWDVSGGRYHATPNGDAISTLGVAGALPTDVELQATVNADLHSGSFFSDALLIFDYQSPTDFKFAGAYVRANKWVIGHRTTSTWVTDVEFSQTINAGTDYQLQLIIENDNSVRLLADGVEKVSHVFAGSLTDGELGLGTWNAFAHFDDVVVQQYVPPPPPPLATLPYQEDFADGVADSFVPQVGSWDVSGGRYHATPNGDAITTLAVSGALPTDVELQATMNADLHSGSFFSDALLIFDYQSPTDFKFAGAYVKANKWVIGHRTASTWVTDVELAQTINAATDYQLQLIIENDNSVRLLANGAERVTHVFPGSLTDGELGLGTWNAFAHFDNVVVQQYVPPPPPSLATLPYQDDFADGVADSFVPRVGIWDTSGGRYHAAPNGDAISTLGLSGALPTDVELQATVNAELHSGSFFSDALLIFDYQSPTDFKFAGAYVKANKWVIGHRTSSSWVTDVQLSQTINADTDYQLRLIIENDNSARLLVNGVQKVSHVFSGSLTDGELGLGTWNAFAHFDDVVAQQYVSGAGAMAATNELASALILSWHHEDTSGKSDARATADAKALNPRAATDLDRKHGPIVDRVFATEPDRALDGDIEVDWLQERLARQDHDRIEEFFSSLLA